jgi:hypothetical protein
VLSETIAFLTMTFGEQLKDNYDVLGLLIVQGMWKNERSGLHLESHCFYFIFVVCLCCSLISDDLFHSVLITFDYTLSHPGTVQYYQESYVTKSGSHVLAEYFNAVTGQLQAKAVDILRKHLHSLVSALEKIDQLGRPVLLLFFCSVLLGFILLLLLWWWLILPLLLSMLLLLLLLLL